MAVTKGCNHAGACALCVPVCGAADGTELCAVEPPVFKRGLFMFSFAAAKSDTRETSEKGNCKETIQK